MKFDLKRATVDVIEEREMSSDKDLFRSIKLYQGAINDLPQPLNRISSLYKGYVKEIKALRHKSRALRMQKYVFEVYVKQYKSATIVEYKFAHQPLGKKYNTEFKEMLKAVVNEAIGNVRRELKQFSEPRSQNFGKFKAGMRGKLHEGRVFVKDGEVLRMYVEKNLKSLYADKLPSEPRKYIGIELEFCAPIKENLFAIKLFKSGIHKFAQLKKDGSLRPVEEKNEVGYELAILLEESNYKKRLKKIIDVLTEVGAVAKDRRAGLHVHLDMRRRNKEIVYSNLVACQTALLTIVDPKRLNNEFCRLVKSRKFPVEFTGEREERYRTINAAAYYKYKTLEVRMHEGSVDFNHISNWVDLLVKIANRPKKLKNYVTRAVTLAKRVKANKKLNDYIVDRSCFWTINHGDSPRPTAIGSFESPEIPHATLEEIRERLAIRNDTLTRPSLGVRLGSHSVEIADTAEGRENV